MTSTTGAMPRGAAHKLVVDEVGSGQRLRIRRPASRRPEEASESGRYGRAHAQEAGLAQDRLTAAGQDLPGR
jgi:hypothetical protein